MKKFEVAYGAKFPEGRRQDHRGRRRAAGVLRLPGRALDPPAHDQPDRVDVRHGQAARTKVTKGHGSKAAGLAMAFKLIESARAPLAHGQRNLGSSAL